MWSVCWPSTPTIRVRIPLKPTVFFCKIVFEKNKNEQKRGRGWATFFKKKLLKRQKSPIKWHPQLHIYGECFNVILLCVCCPLQSCSMLHNHPHHQHWHWQWWWWWEGKEEGAERWNNSILSPNVVLVEVARNTWKKFEIFFGQIFSIFFLLTTQKAFSHLQETILQFKNLHPLK